MNRFSSAAKASFAFIIIVIVLGVGYILYVRQASPQVQDVHSTEIATSSSVVIGQIRSKKLILDSEAKVISTDYFNVTGPFGASDIWTLAYTTTASSAELVKMYKDFLPGNGYIINKEKFTGDRTEILASNSINGVTVDIKPMNGFETVTILLEEYNK